MAISNSKSKTIYAPASSSYGYTLSTEFTETGTSSANNTSTISCSASIGASKIAYNNTDGGTLAVYWHDNHTNEDTLVNSITVSKCGNGGGSNYGTKTASGTITATHNSDGTLSGYSKAVFTKNKLNSYIPPTSNVSTDNTALTSIPRQANVNSATNFNDEQNPTITYTNGAGNSVTSLQACIALTESSAQSNPLIAYRDIPKTGTSYTFTLTDAERNALRNAMPTQNSRNLWFFVRTILNGVTYYSYKIASITIVNANPSIDTIDYADINTATTDLTNDDKIIIQNQSRLQFQMFDVVALKGASLSNLAININGNIRNVTMSGTAITSTTYNYNEVDVSENTTAIITLTDTRGNTASYNVPLTIWEHKQPTAIITLSRVSNFYTQSKINVDANYSSLNGLNTITIEYRIKKTTDDTWGAWSSLSDNVETTFNADNQYAWDVQVHLEDALQCTMLYTINKALDVGIPIVFYDVAMRSVGVNFLPTKSNTMMINGVDLSNVYSTNEQRIGTWIDGKPIYRKTIDYTISDTSQTSISIPTNITDMEFLINANGVGMYSTLFLPLTFYNGGGWNSFHIVQNGTNIVYQRASSNYPISRVFITLEYTKTTD